MFFIRDKAGLKAELSGFKAGFFFSYYTILKIIIIKNYNSYLSNTSCQALW